MSSRTLATILTLVACSPTLHAQRPRAPADTAADPARVGALLAALAHDSMEGRDTGSRGGWAAARLIAAELERAGLAPGGDSGFFQRIPLARQTVTLQSGQTRRRLVVFTDSAAGRDTTLAANRVSAANVVGVLRGGDPALRDEAVVVTAHYDHVGIRAPVNGDSIYNGADDNASGTVAVLEIARLLAQGPPPRRTVVFVLVTGEERGGVGSRWYLGHPEIPLARTAVNVNVEMIGRPDSLAGGSGRGWLTGFDRSTMGRMLREAGIPLVPDPRPEQRFYERSDNIAFARRGIPAHSISSYNLHADYHRPSDEARFADPAHMAAVITAATSTVRLLADGPAPQWTPDDPFGQVQR